MTRLQSSFPSGLPSGATSTKGHLSGIRHHAGYSEHDEILDVVDQLASWQEHAHTVSRIWIHVTVSDMTYHVEGIRRGTDGM